MKSVEYAHKYIKLSEYQTLPDDEFVKFTKDLFWELVDEFKDVATTRHIASMSALNALAKEFNQKGNKITELLGNPLQKDWFKSLFSDLVGKISERKGVFVAAAKAEKGKYNNV